MLLRSGSDQGKQGAACLRGNACRMQRSYEVHCGLRCHCIGAGATQDTSEDASSLCLLLREDLKRLTCTPCAAGNEHLDMEHIKGQVRDLL